MVRRTETRFMKKKLYMYTCAWYLIVIKYNISRTNNIVYLSRLEC